MRIGYVRVSTREQNPDRQIAAMREFGLTDAEIVIEKQSGKDFYRPLYKRAGSSRYVYEYDPEAVIRYVTARRRMRGEADGERHQPDTVAGIAD